MTEGALLAIGILLFIGSIVLFLTTGKPRFRFLLILDISLLFWLIGYLLNLVSREPSRTGTWQMISLMGMTMLLFSFIAAYVDYSRVDT